MKQLIVFCSLFGLIPSALMAELPGSQLAPLEDYFRNPQFNQFKLSPDGKTLAMLAPFEGYMNIYVDDLEDEAPPQALTQEDIDITGFNWVNNERLLYSMNQYTFGSFERRYSGGLFAVNKDGTELEALVIPMRYRNSTNSIQFMDRYDADPEKIMVSNNQRRREHPDVFLMDVYTGGMTRLFNNPARINGYFVDECGRVRFGTSADEKVKIKQYYRTPTKDEWIVLEEDAEDYEVGQPVYINCHNHLGIVSSNDGRDRRALFRKNFLTGKIDDEPFLEDAVYDIDATVKTAIGGQGIVAIRYEAEKPKLVYLDKSHQQIQDMLDQALPDTFNEVMDSDDAGKRVIVRAMSDRKPVSYYLLHLEEMRLEPLWPTRPWLAEEELVETRPIQYEARDGRIIHGYLTLPRQWKEGNPVPLIANPHGGPWARDTWGLRFWYDYEQQYYANRGFAVLKMNFRGSTGYGKDHLESSFKDLQSMHEDVIDGVRWAIAEGYADAEKVGIGGGSWGGYATMTALVKNPEMFQFGINFFGVVDLIEQIKTYRQWDRDQGYEYWIRRAGDPSIEEDREHLEAWSPINELENLDDPVFIYHGVRDFNVDIEQSRVLVRELKKLDKEHTAVFRTDEAHSAFDEENRIDLYRQLEQFLREVTADW